MAARTTRSKRKPRKAAPPPFDYVRRTRELPVNLLFLMPWIVIYELSLMATRSPVENAAAAWLRTLAHAWGRTGLLITGLVVALAMAVAIWMRARDATRDKGVFGGMVIEGLAYGAVLGTLAGVMASSLPMERLAALMRPEGGGMEEFRGSLQELGLAVGAGVFEELIFRGLLAGALFALVRHVIGADRWTSGAVAVIVAAYLFSDYHHWGVTGEVYDAHVFSYRFYAGIFLGVVFLTRGLGIAAFAHGFYDVLVLMGR